jgi:hypothetical protein
MLGAVGCGKDGTRSGADLSAVSTTTPSDLSGHEACPLPTSREGGRLTFLATPSGSVIGTVEVGDSDGGWLLAVECRVRGQSAQQGGGRTVVAGDATWEEVPPASNDATQVRRYRLVGGQCCVYVSVPTDYSEDELGSALGSIEVGPSSSWTPLITDAAERDNAAALLHLRFSAGPTLLVSYRPGLSYQLATDGSAYGCRTLALYVEAAGDPRTECVDAGNDMSGSASTTAMDLWAQVSDADWRSFVAASLEPN